mgnify:CR=1 FL=1
MCEKTEKQHELDKRYLRMAAIWAENSYCKRRQVGALLVKDKMIISDGYNGTPAGFENVCEDENNVTKHYVLHAEANAITKVAASSNSSKGATIYVTSSPCIECAKLIRELSHSGRLRIIEACRYHSRLYRFERINKTFLWIKTKD